MNQKNRISEKIEELLGQCLLAVLATDSSGSPYTSLVGFIAGEDKKTLFFPTYTDTSKYLNITENPHVSLLIDSRKNRLEDFEKASALTVMGTASRVTEGMESAHIASLYLRKYPGLERFIYNAGCAFIQVKVAKYILVAGFHDVHELKVKHS